MKRACILVLIILSLVSGCKNRKYSGRVFDVRVEFWEGDKARLEIWKNANEVSYDSEENTYTFYVDGKLVVLDNASSVVLAEIGSVPPVSEESEQYLGKKFDLSIISSGDVTKTWGNIEIRSADSGRIYFLSDNRAVNILPSKNDTIIIEEMK